MTAIRPALPSSARRGLLTVARRLDALTLEAFTPAWTRPGHRAGH